MEWRKILPGRCARQEIKTENTGIITIPRLRCSSLNLPHEAKCPAYSRCPISLIKFISDWNAYPVWSAAVAIWSGFQPSQLLLRSSLQEGSRLRLVHCPVVSHLPHPCIFVVFLLLRRLLRITQCLTTSALGSHRPSSNPSFVISCRTLEIFETFI